jgi:hypothetical protein
MRGLDITPVLVALRERPYDFTLGSHTLVHTPSRHEFWISNGRGFYGLYRAGGCSCQNLNFGRFTWFQQHQFHRAFKLWRRQWEALNYEKINEQFASHFAPPAVCGSQAADNRYALPVP